MKLEEYCIPVKKNDITLFHRFLTSELLIRHEEEHDYRFKFIILLNCGCDNDFTELYYKLKNEDMEMSLLLVPEENYNSIKSFEKSYLEKREYDGDVYYCKFFIYNENDDKSLELNPIQQC
jgi:hypothetical protein